MLGNIVPLWEVMLAAMKLGAVVIPATTLLAASDLADRFDRGRARHVITTSSETGKFDRLDSRLTRIAVGDPVAGWSRYDELLAASSEFKPDGETHADDPLLLYFTSGTTAKPKLVLHSHRSYPVGHLSTMFALGLQPGDIHLNVSLARLGQTCLELLFRPLERRCRRLHRQPGPLQRPRHVGHHRRQ